MNLKRYTYESVHISTKEEKEHLVKCYNCFFQIAQERKFYEDIAIIEQIAEFVIVYIYLETKTSKFFNNGCTLIDHNTNFMFLNRIRKLLTWRIKDYKKCKRFVVNNSIGLVDDILEDNNSNLEEIYYNMGIEDLTSTLFQAIEQLAPKQKATIKSFYFQDFSMNEIAQIQGVSPETVKSNKKHAMNNLRRMLTIV